ncbi:MAG TPA: uracil-DNA glycosylase [Candidatus Eisenbacteria bacterium]|uniref:Type-4 uracil-DNA glycosylase n=1 Tax=Eiseniibacteriota bacterium TaxID=2212470 RepID=A0A7V2F3X5_UNCEI|nr:uracil-DNA glycosylase [Candidatus Eisenbacteria bacterium]
MLEPVDTAGGRVPGETFGAEDKRPRTEPAGGAPPVRREYAVREPAKGTPEAAQTDLFGEARPAEPVSELSGLDLAALEERVSRCELCPLCKGRTRTVFGSGDPKARIVFVGEAPGREEDLRGEPFVGRAGQLLTKILASVGFTREEVYITNILKCRPPENRDPNEQEVRLCKPYLKRQIELIEPVLICALGRIAGQNLLERNASLSVLRQHIHYYEDVRTIVTYHPAALLRNPNLKRAAWEDIQETRRIYDEALKDA